MHLNLQKPQKGDKEKADSITDPVEKKKIHEEVKAQINAKHDALKTERHARKAAKNINS